MKNAVHDSLHLLLGWHLARGESPETMQLPTMHLEGKVGGERLCQNLQQNQHRPAGRGLSGRLALHLDSPALPWHTARVLTPALRAVPVNVVLCL